MTLYDSWSPPPQRNRSESCSVSWRFGRLGQWGEGHRYFSHRQTWWAKMMGKNVGKSGGIFSQTWGVHSNPNM